MVKIRNVKNEDLISWLSYLDVEYLDSDECDKLSQYNFNDEEDQKKIINIAIIPEYNVLNEISKESLKKILENCMKAEEKDLVDVFERVSMPFFQELKNKQGFLKVIWNVIYSNNRV